MATMSEDKTSVYSVPDLLDSEHGQSAFLIMISAKSAAGIGRMHKLEKSEVVLGRSSECQFQVDDDGISRRHAKVCLAPDGKFQVVDLGSTNGVVLNDSDQPIAPNVAVPIKGGDRLYLGAWTRIVFRGPSG